MSGLSTAAIVAELRAFSKRCGRPDICDPAADRLAELDAERLDIARHLRYLAKELRNADGDRAMVILSDEGVSPCAVTFADSLELIAIQLAGALALMNDDEGPR